MRGHESASLPPVNAPSTVIRTRPSLSQSTSTNSPALRSRCGHLRCLYPARIIRSKSRSRTHGGDAESFPQWTRQRPRPPVNSLASASLLVSCGARRTKTHSPASPPPAQRANPGTVPHSRKIPSPGLSRLASILAATVHDLPSAMEVGGHSGNARTSGSVTIVRPAISLGPYVVPIRPLASTRRVRLAQMTLGKSMITTDILQLQQW